MVVQLITGFNLHLIIIGLLNYFLPVLIYIQLSLENRSTLASLPAETPNPY